MGVIALTELKIEITRTCPLNCLHCSSWGSPHSTQQLDYRRLRELITEFAFLGGKKLCISGGEPLFHEHLLSMVGTASKLGIETSLYTTGIYPNGGHLRPIAQHTLASLEEANVKLIFSLHGANSQSHDRLTQAKGSFEATGTALSTATTKGIPTEVHIVPTTLNFTELIDMANLVSSWGVNRLSWLRFVPQGRGQSNAHFLRLRREQFVQLTQVKTEIKDLCPTLEIRTGAPFNILCPEVPVSCNAAMKELVICPDGRAVPCDAFKGFYEPDEFGNILSHSLGEVWERSLFLNKVRHFQSARSSALCVSCPAYDRCRSGCLAQKATTAQRLTAGKDPECLLHCMGVERGNLKAVPVR